MSHIVKRAFKTVNRKFAVGDAVAHADIHGVLPFDHWLSRGFIGAKEAPVKPAAPVIESTPHEASADEDKFGRKR